MSDNFHFDLTGVSLDVCLDVAFSGSPSRKAVAWAVQEKFEADPDKRWEKSTNRRLVLFWHESAKNGGGDCDVQLLPAPMTAEQSVPFVKAWLQSEDYGSQPDHDGNNGKGWRVYNESWTHIDRAGSYSFVAIEPVWLMYGK